MAEGKQSFLLYSDYISIFEQLTDDEAGKMIKHLFRYVNDMEPELEDRMLKILFEPIKAALKRDLKKWEGKRVTRSEAGRMGGLKSAEVRRSKLNQNEANEANASNVKQNQANEAVSVIVNDTVTVNVNDNDLYKYSVERCQEIALKDERWVKLNKATETELTRFNEYLQKQAVYEMNPAEYKRYFHFLKEKKPDKVKQKLTIEDYRRMAIEQDQKLKLSA